MKRKKTSKNKRQKQNKRHLYYLLAGVCLVVALLAAVQYVDLKASGGSLSGLVDGLFATPISTLTSIPTAAPIPTKKPIQKIAPQVDARCPQGTYFADIPAMSFCYPKDWEVSIDPNTPPAGSAAGPSYVYITKENESIRFEELDYLEVPAGGNFQPQRRDLLVDGYNTLELINNNGKEMELLIYRKGSAAHAETWTNGGYVVDYTVSKKSGNNYIGYDLLPDGIATMHIFENTFHIKKWTRPLPTPIQGM